MTNETFKHPKDIYRGTDFWMLNGRLNDEDIVSQLKEMKDKGVYSFIARTYLGLKSDYPGADSRLSCARGGRPGKDLCQNQGTWIKGIFASGIYARGGFGSSRKLCFKIYLPRKKG